jgi:hypothetical protein
MMLAIFEVLCDKVMKEQDTSQIINPSSTGSIQINGIKSTRKLVSEENNSEILFSRHPP